MKFARSSAYHLASECGRYTVSRSKGTHGERYTAWLRLPGKSAEILGVFDDSRQARDCARKHAGASGK